jgi:hypothetical protein
MVTRAMMRVPGAWTKPPLRFRVGKTHNDPNFRPEPGAWRSRWIPRNGLACQMWPRNSGVGHDRHTMHLEPVPPRGGDVAGFMERGRQNHLAPRLASSALART